ncbi:HIT family hydrolase [Nocardia thailandica]|uniref:HIT family hydrolase n=1 Tax=Nocardia thailandica TaxID=257275 RepID=UPI000301BB6F|nr:HIT family hydrolase [Nocardia thailandica]
MTDRDATVLARMRTGVAVFGDTQHLPGYSVLLYDGDADHLTDLPRPERLAFLTDLMLLGEAVETACRAVDPAFLRINYEVLGNSVHRLHGHVHARYGWEPEERRRGPVWLYGSARVAPEHRPGAAHEDVRLAIAAALRAILDGV